MNVNRTESGFSYPCKNYSRQIKNNDKWKQPSRGVLRKRCSENTHQIYRRTPCRSAILIKLLCNFIEITLRHGCSPVNMLHIFRTPVPKNTSEGPVLDKWKNIYQMCFFFCSRHFRFSKIAPNSVIRQFSH